MPLLERFKQSWLWRLLERYSAANVGVYAAVIAYNALFSIFPITLAIAFIVGRLLRDPNALALASSTLAQFLPGDAAAEIDRVLITTREGSGIAGIIGLIGLLWAGSSLFGALAEGFNRIYGVPNRPFVRERIMAVVMIVVFGALLLLSIGLSAVAQFLLQFASLLPISASPGIQTLVPALSFFLSFLSALALFVVVYYVVPNVRLGFGDIWRGAVLGAVLFVLLAQVFPLYVGLIGKFERYGALFGFAFLLLTWLYFIAQVLLLGAALNASGNERATPRAV